MKNLLLIFVLTSFTALSSYGQNTNIKSMLQDQQNREQVYQTIMKDQSYMKEFMQEMRQNKQAMQMMNDNQGMKPMMQGQQMHGMMQDSTAMNQMMQSMMQDPERMQQMMRMMHQNGMMSDDCMKAGMKKMKKMQDNGMQMKGQKKGKGMKKESGSNDHPSNN